MGTGDLCQLGHEVRVGEPRMAAAKFAADATEHLAYGTFGEHLVALADAALEQERLRFAGHPLAFVVAGG